MTRLCFIDTETTSLDDRRGEVWEIGVIIRDPGKPDVEHEWQIRPNLNGADPMSLRISRYYERRAPMTTLPRNVARDLARIVDGAHIIGAVPDFDVRFLRKFLTDYGECWTGHYHLIDIENLAIGYIRGILAQGARENPDLVNLLTDLVDTLPWKYTSLCKAFGIDPAQYDVHTALSDARCVRDLYDKITQGALTLDPGTALAA